MECKNCHNDLLVRIEPKGLGNILRLVPMAPYRCVKCGARHWRASDDWGRTGTRAGLMAAVLVAMIWAIWHANRPAEPRAQAPANMVREEVDATARAPRVQETPLAETRPEAASAAAALPREVPLDEPMVVAQADIPARPVTTESLRRSAGAAEGRGLDEVSVQPGSAPDAAEKPAATAPAAPAPAQPDAGWLNPPPERLVGEPAKAGARPGKVTAIDFLPETDRLLITVAAGGPVENAETHLWPPKFVVDLPGKWDWSGPADIPVGKRGVVRIRAAAHEDKFRIVLDMKAAPTTEPVIQTSPGGLLILVP